jgi:hypothetical protein
MNGEGSFFLSPKHNRQYTYVYTMTSVRSNECEDVGFDCLFNLNLVEPGSQCLDKQL